MKNKQSKIEKTKEELAGIPGVVVLTSDEVFEKSYTETERVHAAALHELGSSIVLDTVKLGSKYFELCKYIRDNKIAPRLASHELAAVGFHKVRISEVNRVANAGDDVWSEIEAGMIGFAKALDLSRNTVTKLIGDERGKTVLEIEAEVAEVQHAAGGEGLKKPKETLEQKLARLCKTVLEVAEILNVRKKTFSLHGFTVTVAKQLKANKNKQPKTEGKA